MTAAGATLVPVENRQRWDDLVDRLEGGFFSQNWAWGEARRLLGWIPYRLMLPGEDGAPVAAVQVCVRRIPLLGFGIAHAPCGPLGARDPQVLDRLTAALRSWARSQRVATVVMDPPEGPDTPMGRFFEAAPWEPAPALGEARVHVLDLDPGHDPWQGVRRRHREWVRRSEKAGVTVTWTDEHATPSEADAAWTAFDQVYSELIERLDLPTHGPVFTRRVWDEHRTDGRAQLAVAWHRDAPVAAMLHLRFGRTLVWYAGAQNEAGAPVGAGKLLLWRSIQRAHELGMERYHMWGTASDSLAHYKEGFGAREVRHLGTRALVAAPWPHRIVRLAWAAQRRSTILRRRVITLRRGHDGDGERLRSLGLGRRAGLGVKRAMDVAGALVALALFSPILAWTALALVVTQGRPILFRHERPGLHGRPFTLLKFRTMRAPRPDEVWYSSDASRITRIGRFLRATSIDELPQLVNVLRGEMSLVGPRPLLTEYLDRYTPEEARRHEMRPGITGWAAVNGRNTARFEDRLKQDTWYVEHWSLALDLRIIAMTIQQVLRRTDASAVQELEDIDFPARFLEGLDAALSATATPTGGFTARDRTGTSAVTEPPAT